MKHLLPILLPAFAMTLAPSCDAPETPEMPETSPQTNEEHNQVLEGLGFDTEIGARRDASGEPLPDTWHPLGSHFASFFPARELYLAGPIFGDAPETLRDDASSGYAPMEFSSHPDPSWTTAEYKDAVAADVDGDGFEEIVAVYFAPGSSSLKYIIIDANDGSTRTGVLDPAANSANLDPDTQPNLAAGDVDNGGVDEVAIGFGKLYLLREDSEGASVRTRSFASQNEVMVAMGNTDRDAEDELVVTHTETGKGYYEVVDGGELDMPSQAGDLVVTDQGNIDRVFGETRVAIGDINGDRLGDIIFHGRSIADPVNAWSVFVLSQKHGETDYRFRRVVHQVHTSGHVPWTLVLLDVDGDSIDEVFAWNQLFNIGEDGSIAPYAEVEPHFRAVAGNVDADRREELILAHNDRYSVYGLNGLDTFVRKHQEAATTPLGRAPVLALANVDADSALVRYDGEHELLFTAPNLIAVMASPPYQAGIGQDTGSTSSTFGAVEATEVVESQSMGVSVGFSIGYTYEANLFGVINGFSAKATVESAFDYHASQSSSRESYYSHTTAPGEDKVIFSTVPFDVYYYTIVSSPDSEEVGRRISINMPRNQQVLGSSIDFYNQSNGGAQDLDDAFLGHRVGDPWSYPTLEDRDTILIAAAEQTPGYEPLWNGPLQVDESGSNTLGLSTSEGSARGSAMDFSSQFEFEATAGGFTAGASVGFHYGYEIEVSTEEGAFYEGSVGAIPGEHYADSVYCYGLMVYPRQAGNQRFTMLDYWTQRRCGGQ